MCSDRYGSLSIAGVGMSFVSLTLNNVIFHDLCGFSAVFVHFTSGFLLMFSD